MLTKRENFLETIKRNGHPDRLVNHYEALSVQVGDPISMYVRGNRYRGMPPMKDRWGVTYVWPEDQIAGMPDHNGELQALKDITDWKNTLKVPDLTQCSDIELWQDFLAKASQVDRNETMLTGFMPGGVFEQLHALMGFEDALVNFLEEPEAMMELCECIGDYRLSYLKLLAERLQPDAILFHDDWGTKYSLFMSPEIWRTFIKPQYAKLYGYAKKLGIIIIHHADSFLEPIVEDMAEIGIDVWQGVLPENDICMLQQKLGGKMTLMGGIDVSKIDRADSTEEDIRAEARRACMTYAQGGHYIPSLTYGDPKSIFPHVLPLVQDEISRFSQELF